MSHEHTEPEIECPKCNWPTTEIQECKRCGGSGRIRIFRSLCECHECDASGEIENHYSCFKCGEEFEANQ